MIEERKVRVGIDVGGTHTKAVAIDNETHEIVGIGSVKTTHDDELGVSAGVVEAFRKCLNENNISPDDVIFIAHSTTQATNALLEGDVAVTGIIGMGKGGFEGLLARKQSNIADITLDDSGVHKIKTHHRYLKLKDYSREKVEETINELQKEGATVLVASEVFGVDNNKEEMEVQAIGKARGIEVSAASDISKMYGLTRRTRTATINASILPKMFETADSTESSVKKAGINVPLMIMRGDGGVMDINEMRKRPVMTMLSGPAASTTGALMYLKASNAIFFEVGGTSTDIGVIKNGRPMVDYAVVGGHKTLISSLDVHVSGVAGGSMVRADLKSIVKAGPRSAHIAKLPYAAFTPPEEIINPKVVRIQPLEGDPSDYIAIESEDGSRVAITVTCAANALKILSEEDYSYGNYESCVKAIEPLAKELGKTVEQVATDILENASDTVIKVIEELALKHKVERDQIQLVGGGGGATSLLPFTAKKMNLNYQIAEHAEVISSIGVALAMVRDVVERVVPNPTADDIAQIRAEAVDSAVKSGASPETIEVQIEIDSQTNQIRAIALGSTEMQTTDLTKEVDEEEARQIAAESLKANPFEINIVAQNDSFFVFGLEKEAKNQIRVVDKKGFIKVQRSDGTAVTTTTAGARNIADKLWEELAVYKSDIKLTPDIYLCLGGKVMDYTGMLDLNQLHMVMDTELMIRSSADQVILIGAKNNL
ncbi:hydantoinase/oxoprolinase family protein [Desemzia sp. RIT804]|uniref:hydantoinase/oxoprolinase family protein n=1 Tax=Desemzia sp. RIT 804 TaxID=2810209 RepID=UPI00194F761E|nr:hydantoinase/oxoprolinase family protein [Desemzia sp. RIT 804]MBM6615177.1 hydantoinase/oxoprolinase family protein [Desemzia sp. RIT 804]